MDKLIFGGRIENESKIKENCKLNMIVVNSEIGAGKITFEQFFETCIKYENDPNSKIIIPIAILRAPTLGAISQYIVTNPKKNCLLFVIIISNRF